MGLHSSSRKLDRTTREMVSTTTRVASRSEPRTPPTRQRPTHNTRRKTSQDTNTSTSPTRIPHRAAAAMPSAIATTAHRVVNVESRRNAASSTGRDTHPSAIAAAGPRVVAIATAGSTFAPFCSEISAYQRTRMVQPASRVPNSGSFGNHREKPSSPLANVTPVHNTSAAIAPGPLGK